MKLIDLDNSWGEGILQDWYIHSVDPDDIPQWADEHIEELCKDFYVIPKETTKYDIDCNADRLKELAEADKEERLKIYPKGLKCPSCEKYTVYSSVDYQFYLCYSCGFRYSKEEAEKALEGLK